MEVGSLTAFLAYLVQILMAVMMATFMATMIPRAAVSAGRITEVLDTTSSVVGVGAADPDPARRRRCRVRRRRLPLPRRRARRAARHHVRGAARPHDGDHRLDRLPARRRCSDWCRASSTSASGGSRSAASTCATSSSTPCGRGSASCPQKPYLFTGTVASNLRYGNPEATDEELWEALRISQAADFVEEMGGLESADRPGRHQRLRRSAPAPRHRAGRRQAARHLPLRRLVLGARPVDGRAAACRAAAGDGPQRRSSSSPSGCRPSSTPTTSSCSTTVGSSARARTTSCSRRARPTRRSSCPSAARRRQPDGRGSQDRGGEGGRGAARTGSSRRATAHGDGPAGGEVAQLRPVGQAPARAAAARSASRSSPSSLLVVRQRRRSARSARRSSAAPPTSSSAACSASSSPRRRPAGHDDGAGHRGSAGRRARTRWPTC